MPKLLGMIAMRSIGWGFLFTALVITGVGCGSGQSLTKVRGTVTLDGKPIEGATVGFFPTQGSSGKYAFGRTGADGSFQLTTTKPDDGAFPGDYVITVQYEEGYEVPPAPSLKAAKEAANKIRQQKIKKPPKYAVPAIYSDPGKTPFRQKVPPDGPVKLQLQSK